MVQGDIVRVLMRGKRTVGTKEWTGILLPNGKKGYVDTKDLQLISKKSDKEEVSGKSIIEVAKQYLGTPYFWGGKSIKGVDCSGLVYNAWFMNGMLLPRDASQQALLGVPVKIYDRHGKLNIKNLKTGDLIFFGKKFPDTITHVGIYIGKGKFIHSSQVVRINSLLEYDNDYYESHALPKGFKKSDITLTKKVKEVFENMAAQKKAILNVGDALDKSQITMQDANTPDPHVWFNTEFWGKEAEALTAKLSEMDKN